MRGRQEAEGDSHWGQIEGKRFDALCWYGFREWAPPQLRTEKPMLGLLHQRILMAIEEGWVKIHFQKASHWYFLFTSFSSRLCLCTVLCRTWGEEETGWNRLSLASLFFLHQILLHHLSLLSESAATFPLAPPSVYPHFLSPRQLIAFSSCVIWVYSSVCFCSPVHPSICTLIYSSEHYGARILCWWIGVVDNREKRPCPCLPRA